MSVMFAAKPVYKNIHGIVCAITPPFTSGAGWTRPPRKSHHEEVYQHPAFCGLVPGPAHGRRRPAPVRWERRCVGWSERGPHQAGLGACGVASGPYPTRRGVMVLAGGRWWGQLPTSPGGSVQQPRGRAARRGRAGGRRPGPLSRDGTSLTSDLECLLAVAELLCEGRLAVVGYHRLPDGRPSRRASRTRRGRGLRLAAEGQGPG